MLFYSQACLDTDSFVACNWYFYLRFAVFFSSLLTFENHTFDIIPEPQQDWKPAVIANCKLWVPFQFNNFLVVPQPLQVAFANVVALAWNIYLSFASHTEVYTAPQTSPAAIEMSAPGDQKV
jgi:hypothetical protein